ncbi:hypothetical protein D9611_013117 [Ephemerocybe angulata]|uniref:Helitron helicase-like domain-containing protein n=1 Tax=Ephemerocybe angulata TaxID=980116 RepID=A0A8H5BXN0_9AGAR|nr:hypothetical protein D9611_013117 [Tulosesus angulatus]
MYDNPQLYPQMFPWLFPYGLGGIGMPRLRGLVGETVQKRWLLMYHDKRFQTDTRFIIVAFNHDQLKAGSTGSRITAKRGNFLDVARKMKGINPDTLKMIAGKLQDGEQFKPSTDEEKACFDVMDQVNHVGGSIHGSLASKKNMRSEVWSLINFRGAPSWFITISPVDNKHPLCIYWADKVITFSPDLREYNDRARLVAKNPVAGARFFKYLVDLFIKHVLRWKQGDGKPGIYGNTAAYFGTVEQQGRMTLHLHMLVWVAGAWRPQDIKDRLMSGDSAFVRDLIAYLESCQVGEFSTGTMADMVEKHGPNAPVKSVDPTQCLPIPPPKCTCPALGMSSCDCQECSSLRAWLDQYNDRVDSVVYGSNVHTCFLRRNVVVNGVHTHHISGKGCINKDGVCTARFPRPIIEISYVDEKGTLHLKKMEARINTITPTTAYCMGCNTDTTPLCSGTAIKESAGYIVDYVVKMGLKTYQIFSSIYDVFGKNTDIWEESKSDADAARRLVLKMANSLTSKIEIGGPMAALYLLGHPDRYSSHSFLPFYWRPYAMDVLKEWEMAAERFDDRERNESAPSQSSFNVRTADLGDEEKDSESEDSDDGESGDEEDDVMISRNNGNFVSRSNMDDYKMRPAALSSVCLYDYVQCSVRKHLSVLKKGRSPYYLYDEAHPLHASHGVVFDISRKDGIVPNFIGPYLPRKDSEDRDYYCCVMLTLFSPWRSGLDLKQSSETWCDAFDAYQFSEHHSTIIHNLYIRYECYDARDDYFSQLKLRVAAQKNNETIADATEEDAEC